jgi:hypothetical protein
MRYVLALLLAVPAAAAPPHSGQVIDDGFEPSDVALFAVAAAGVWLAQRSMRKRARARRDD